MTRSTTPSTTASSTAATPGCSRLSRSFITTPSATPGPSRLSTVQQSSPKSFASTIAKLIEVATPRKSATLKRGYQITKSKHRLFQKQLEKGMKSIASNITKKNEDSTWQLVNKLCMYREMPGMLLIRLGLTDKSFGQATIEKVGGS